MKLEGDAPWALWSRGLAHAQLGDSRAAHQDLDRALALLDGAEREEMLASTCRQLTGQGVLELPLRYCAKTVSQAPACALTVPRSDERRVEKVFISTCRSRWSPIP